MIPNGVDCSRFRPDPAARAEVRRELRLDAGTFLIAFVARHHPLKDHDAFFRAAALTSADRPDVRYLLCGPGVEASNARLAAQMEASGVADRVRLLGPRRDVQQLLAASDAAVLTSRSEAFPLAVVEAMACGTPCAATDVGDCAAIVDDRMLTAPPGDARAIAESWRILIDTNSVERARRATAVRRRVVELYSLETAAAAYADFYARLLRSSPCRSRLGAEEFAA